MKNKVKIAVCAIFVVIFSLLPMSVFAKTDNASPALLYQIAKDSGADCWSDFQIIVEDENNYYLIMVGNIWNDSGGFGGYARVSSKSYPLNIEIGGGFIGVRYKTDFCTFPKDNIYDVTVDKNWRYYEFGSYTGTSVNNVTNILYCNKDVIYKNGDTNDVFFPLMNSVPNTPANRVPLNTVLSSIQLTGILGEVIALLPILFPVLITFIAIRKGIAFCLATLRTA